MLDNNYKKNNKCNFDKIDSIPWHQADKFNANIIIISTKNFTVRFETQRWVVPVLRWNYFVDKFNILF